MTLHVIISLFFITDGNKSVEYVKNGCIKYAVYHRTNEHAQRNHAVSSRPMGGSL
jgi:hypothetical protein